MKHNVNKRGEKLTKAKALELLSNPRVAKIQIGGNLAYIRQPLSGGKWYHVVKGSVQPMVYSKDFIQDDLRLQTWYIRFLTKNNLFVDEFY